MKKKFAAAIAAAIPLLALPPGAAAQVSRQPEVVVTASRVAQTVDDTLASVTVITRAEIERLQATDLLEILRLQAGVDLARTGGSGSATTLFLRGTNSNQTLLLIDGVRVSSTGQGAYDLAHVPPEQVERIEIVRGPRASYWGSDAIGGVIQIFTRRPQGTLASVRAGSYGRLGGTAAYGHRGDGGYLGVTVGGEKLDGFSATNENAFGFDPDDDGYYNRNVSLRGDTVLGTQRVEFAALSTDADIDFDQGQSSSEEQSGAATLAGPVTGNWSHSATLGYARGVLDTPAFGNHFESRRQTLDWQHDVLLGPVDAVVVGINLVHEEGRLDETFSDSVTFDETRNNRALHASWRRARGGFDSELAARYDDNSAFGSEPTYQAAVGWRFDARTWVFASVGEGFRAPSLNQLYSPGFGGTFAGNPLLQPERSRSVEAGVDWRADDASTFKARIFHTRVRDLIAFDGEDFQAINIGRARIRGAELTYAWRGDAGIDFDANYTWQEPEDQDTGRELLRRPGHKLNAILSQRFASGFEWGAEGIYAGERRDFAADLPSYAIANLRASYAFGAEWRLDARVENVFDRSYELASGYNTPDRSVRVALVYGGGQP